MILQPGHYQPSRKVRRKVTHAAVSAGATGADVVSVAPASPTTVSRLLEVSVSFEACEEPVGAAVLPLAAEAPLPVSFPLADAPPLLPPSETLVGFSPADCADELSLLPPPDADLLALDPAATTGMLGDFPSLPLLSYTQNWISSGAMLSN